jgi:tRNA(fMet)-specific endonuclease VapC
MTGRFLLDTNIVIALFAKEAVVQASLANAAEVFIPSIVLGELYYGANKSLLVAENIAKIDEFAASNSTLVCDTRTAQAYGQIKNSLRAKGRPIPENDIWIAALGKQHSLTLITRDAHLGEVEGLAIEA